MGPQYAALVAENRQERDMIKLRQVDLAALIRDLEADTKQMTDYRAAAVAVKAPKADKVLRKAGTEVMG